MVFRWHTTFLNEIVTVEAELHSGSQTEESETKLIISSNLIVVSLRKSLMIN